MRVVFTRSAEKALDRLLVNRRRQIVSRIAAVAAEPRSRRHDVEPLGGSELLRLRVGDYRVLFTVDDAEDVIRVELIRTRGDVYKR